jgi:hypothetical protein
MTFNDIAWWSQIVWRIVLMIVVLILVFRVLKDWSWVKEFLQDEKGKPSSTRITSLAVTWVFCFSYIKIVVAQVEGITLPDIPLNWLFIIATLLGINYAGAIFMKKFEGGTNGNGTTSTTVEKLPNGN